jgi:hypothetical protein
MLNLSAAEYDFWAKLAHPLTLVASYSHVFSNHLTVKSALW